MQGFDFHGRLPFPHAPGLALPAGPSFVERPVSAFQPASSPRGSLHWPPLPHPLELAPPNFASTEQVLRQVREVRFAGGVHCPRCRSDRVHRWGSFAGRQRYRCTGCRRTFSDLTGTAMAYSKRLDRYPSYAGCLLRGLSVRKTGALIGINKDTAWRWRHRLLNERRRLPAKSLATVVEIMETGFFHSMKGCRSLGRPAHRRGPPKGSNARPGVWVLLARDRVGTTLSDVIGPRHASVADLRAALQPRCSSGTVVVSALGPASPHRAFCNVNGFQHHAMNRFDPRWRRLDPASARETAAPLLHMDNVRRYAAQLHGWMLRFRGVATRYLANYLCLHRIVAGREWAGAPFRVLTVSPVDRFGRPTVPADRAAMPRTEVP